MFNLKVTHKDGAVLQSLYGIAATLLTLVATLYLSTEAWAGDTAAGRVTTSLYGKAGLVEMPNALFFDTGHLSMTGMIKDPDNRITMNFQPLPWFEGSFRYSVIEDYARSRKHQPDLFDRSFDFKVKVLEQGSWWPAVAFGIQDIAGTGIYSAEFVVATWQTRHLNLTGGAGFGRFATRGNLTNPLTFVSDAAKSRVGFNGSIFDTGQVRTGQFFKGEDMGLFGGIEYLTPVKGLKVIAEYSSDAYRIEESRNLADADFPINFGASYRYGNNMEFGASLVQGNTLAMRFTMQMNPISQRDPPRLDPPRFQFRNREDDPVSDVKPLASESDFYRQYTALQNKQRSQTNRDYLSVENIWQPWEKKGRLDNMTHASVRRFEPVPKRVDIGWIEFAGVSGTPVGDAVHIKVDNTSASSTPRNWRLATSNDETSFVRSEDPVREFKSILLPSLPPTTAATADLTLADYAAPTQKDREALAQALKKTWSWPLTEEDKLKIAESIRQAASVQKIATIAVDFEDTKLTVYYYNGKYHRESEAIGRLLAILTQASPGRIEHFSLIAVINDLQVNEFQVPRRSLERIVSNYGSPQELFNVATFSEGPKSRPAGLPLAKGWLPTIDYGLSPSFRFSLFDPDDPMRYQISALLAGTVGLYDGLSISGILRLNIYDNFDEITRGAGSALPHVRTDFAKYLNTSEHGMEMLSLNYAWQPAHNWYARSFVGYLEEMYVGVGGEALYRPYGKRWAVGLEVDYVRQRDFDRGFGLRDYKTVTGFAKWYYEVPYEDLRVELNVGRYLAEDIGATFKISRTFDNGTEIGAFATLTDVPFETFGEGSFDKGVIIKIPFHLFSFFDTKQVYSTVIRPLTRDGGAQVWSGPPLYDLTQQFTLGNIRRNWEAIFE